MEQYRVQKVTPCGECQGSGYLSNPLWLDFMEKYPPGVLKSMSVEEYKILLLTYKLVGEPEKLTCYACSGSGESITLVEFKDVPLIQDFLKRIKKLEEDKWKKPTVAVKEPTTQKDDDRLKTFEDEFNERFGPR
jgi:hypothetical protein